MHEQAIAIVVLECHVHLVAVKNQAIFPTIAVFQIGAD